MFSVWATSGPGRCAPGLSIAISVALKASFQLHKCQCPGPSGRPDVYKRKKHSVLLCFLVAGRRIELRTSWLWIMRSNQLSYPAVTVSQNVVEIEGLEPSLTEPESVVLPLHHISIWLPIWFWDCKGMNVLWNMQNFFWKINGILLFTWKYPDYCPIGWCVIPCGDVL